MIERIKIKRIICMIIFAIILSCIFLGDSLMKSHIRPGNVVSAFLEKHDYFHEIKFDEIKKGISTFEQVNVEEQMLRINEATCAYDNRTNTFLMPLSKDIVQGDIITLDIEFDNNATHILLDGIDYSKDTGVKVSFKKKYEITVIDNGISKNFYLEFTKLPIMTCFPINTIVHQLHFYDPNNPQYTDMTTNLARVEIRGNTSLQYDKKNYNLKFIDSDINKIEVAFPNLREDDDWVLEGAYNDYSRMRKNVLMDIWCDISTVYYDENVVNGCRGMYVELFLHNEYKGLYFLHERIDGKQLGLASNDNGLGGGLLYKGKAWTYNDKLINTFRDIPDPPIMAEESWGGMVMTYPNVNDKIYKYDWDPFYELAYLTTASDDKSFNEHVSQMIDYENLIEYYLFINLVKGTGNMGKNIFFSVADTQTPEKRKIFITPWDLDDCVGRSWQNEIVSETGMVTNGLYTRLIEQNTDSFNEMLMNKWKQLRQDEFSLETLMSRFYNANDLLNSSGTLRREANRWDETMENREILGIKFRPIDIDSELEYISQWFENRLNYLDGEILNEKIG